MHCFTGTGNVHIEERGWFSLHLHAFEKKVSLLHDDFKKILSALADDGCVRPERNGVRKDVKNCFPIFISIRRDILEGKDMSYVKHAIAVMRQLVKFRVAMDDIHDL